MEVKENKEQLIVLCNTCNSSSISKISPGAKSIERNDVYGDRWDRIEFLDENMLSMSAGAMLEETRAKPVVRSHRVSRWARAKHERRCNAWRDTCQACGQVLSLSLGPLPEEKKHKKMFIQIKNIWYSNVYIHKLKLSIKYFNLYNSDISHAEKVSMIWYKIESTLIVRCTYSGYGLDVITKNT